MIIFPAILESFRSLKDKTLKVTFETNEVTPEQLTGIGQSLNNFGFVAFKETPFKDKDKEVMEGLEPDYNETGKTPAQRLRGVFYRLYEQSPEGFKTFTTYYEHHMEILTNHFKSKLD